MGLEQNKDIIKTKINGRFTTNEVLDIVVITRATLQNWVRHNLIIGHKTMTGGKRQGVKINFSFSNVMEIALAKKLIDAGITANIAFKASRDFAHIGGGGDIFDLPERFPGFPFHQNEGETAFAFCGEHSFEMLIGKDGALQTINNHLHGGRNPKATPMIIVNASALFDEVCGAIGIHPYATLDGVYGVAD